MCANADFAMLLHPPCGEQPGVGGRLASHGWPSVSREQTLNLLVVYSKR
jgi:hypothetical protein